MGLFFFEGVFDVVYFYLATVINDRYNIKANFHSGVLAAAGEDPGSPDNLPPLPEIHKLLGKSEITTPAGLDFHETERLSFFHNHIYFCPASPVITIKYLIPLLFQIAGRRCFSPLSR